MGIIRRRFLFEDEGQDNTGGQQPTVSGGEDTGGAEDYSVDTQDDADTTTNDNTDNNTQDTQSDNNQAEETNNDQNNEDQQQDTDEDYSINTDEDKSQTDDTGEGEGNDTDTDNSSNDNTQSSEPEEENELDKELFDNLTDDEKKRKVNTLKKLYIDLYSKCNALIEKFNQMSEGDQDLQEVSKRVLKIIYDLKEYISYYVLNIFDNKSYLENDINFNRYLLILNGVKDAVGDIAKSKEKEEPKYL